MKKLLVIPGAIILLIVCVLLLPLAVYASIVLPVERSVGFAPTVLPERCVCKSTEYEVDDTQVDVTVCVELSELCAKSENRRWSIYQ